MIFPLYFVAYLIKLLQKTLGISVKVKSKKKLFASMFKSICQVLIKKSMHLKKIRMVPKHSANQNGALFIINTIYDE